MRPARGGVAAGARAAVLATGVALLAACGDDPMEVVFEVIEEVSFDASLGIDLADFTKLSSGVYIKEVDVGAGDVIAQGDIATVNYVGWLRTGLQFDAGTYQYDYLVINDRSPIAGWHLGMEGMAVGGKRVLIIPPEHAYGERAVGPIPAGSVLVFEVELVSLG